MARELFFNFELNLKVKCYKGKLIVQQIMEKVSFYSFLINGEDGTETEKFILKFRDHDIYKRDFNIIMAAIKEMGSRRGASIEYFRGEKLGEALPPPYEYGCLRLYCGRFSRHIVILCNGGIKTSNSAQNSPNCKPHFELMNALMKAIDKRIREGDLKEENGRLTGNLKFEIGNCYEQNI